MTEVLGTKSPSAPPSVTKRFLKECFPTLTALILAFLVCVVAPTTLISVHIHENPAFSPIDEPEQFDYVNRIAEGSIPRLGQHLLPSTLRALSCNGLALPAAVEPPCPGTDNPKDYDGGYQYEAQQPPTYYAVTAPLRWVGVHALRMSRLTATRAVGALWVSVGLVLLWMAGRVLKIKVSRLVPAILFVATAPVVIYQSSIVSNDAASIFAGSSVALAAALAWRKPGRWTAPVLGLLAFFVTTMKSVDILPSLIVSALFAIIWWKQAEEESAPMFSRIRSFWTCWWPNGGALLVGGVVSALAWIVISRRLSLINPKALPSFNVLRTAPVGLTLIARESVSLLDPLYGSYAPFRTNRSGVWLGSFDSLNLQQITGPLLEYLFIGVGAAGLFVRRREWGHWLGLLSLFFLYLIGVVLGTGIWHTFNDDPGLSGRYGLSAVPFLALAMAATVRSRWVIAALWVSSIGLCGLTFWYILAT